MKIAFVSLLWSVPQLSRILISASVKERRRRYPMTQMTMKCWFVGQSSLSTSEKSPFSTYRLGGRKRLFLRPETRYRLHRRHKARRINLLCFPSSSRYGSGPRASLSRGRCLARLVPPPPHSRERLVLVSRISLADMAGRDYIYFWFFSAILIQHVCLFYCFHPLPFLADTFIYVLFSLFFVFISPCFVHFHALSPPPACFPTILLDMIAVIPTACCFQYGRRILFFSIPASSHIMLYIPVFVKQNKHCLYVHLR